jgi:hypothetical protein
MEHPKGPLGTVKGHKTTKKQQALFGIARGMQKGETPKGYSKKAAKLSGGLSGKEVHKIASKPKRGYRRSPTNGESALARVMQLVTEFERPGFTAPETDFRNPGLASHADADEDKFAEIIRRLEALEKAVFKGGASIGAIPDAAMELWKS